MLVIRKYTAEWVDPPLYVLLLEYPDGSQTPIGEPSLHSRVEKMALGRRGKSVILDEESGIAIAPGEDFAAAFRRSTGVGRG